MPGEHRGADDDREPTARLGQRPGTDHVHAGGQVRTQGELGTLSLRVTGRLLSGDATSIKRGPSRGGANQTVNVTGVNISGNRTVYRDHHRVAPVHARIGEPLEPRRATGRANTEALRSGRRSRPPSRSPRAASCCSGRRGSAHGRRLHRTVDAWFARTTRSTPRIPKQVSLSIEIDPGIVDADPPKTARRPQQGPGHVLDLSEQGGYRVRARGMQPHDQRMANASRCWRTGWGVLVGTVRRL